jgi:hypothetical protein
MRVQTCKYVVAQSLVKNSGFVRFISISDIMYVGVDYLRSHIGGSNIRHTPTSPIMNIGLVPHPRCLCYFKPKLGTRSDEAMKR